MNDCSARRNVNTSECREIPGELFRGQHTANTYAQTHTHLILNVENGIVFVVCSCLSQQCKRPSLW